MRAEQPSPLSLTTSCRIGAIRNCSISRKITSHYVSCVIIRKHREENDTNEKSIVRSVVNSLDMVMEGVRLGMCVLIDAKKPELNLPKNIGMTISLYAVLMGVQ